ncbi:MAG: UDP-N-acetylmuramate dehydrogenase [Aquificaceae bacterium]|jgi:UDP-N-acetylmuramate dehydrogenase|uniref:UDP-N-acetylmuramate dehydrogenase n=1 Tax=Hydrogenobacter sp. Uz 6-8 TaxID=3384828 RepID=UPI0030B1BDBC
MLIRERVGLSSYTTIGVGGKAKYFAQPDREEDLRYLLFFAQDKGLEVFILGRGANTIFGDFDGLVIGMRSFKALRVKGEGDSLYIEAQAGVPLSELVNLSLRENLEGFYRLGGFPATVGGAVAMNAGAFGYDISAHLVEVSFMDWEGRVHRAKKEELNFTYRGSPFPELGMVFLASFRVPLSRADVRKEYELIRERRKRTQPINMLTSGSTFKNPPGDYAGRLLEKVGMKGFRVGSIAFSELHANFLVNLGGGNYEEVVRIIEEAKRRVFEEFGINLEEEVRLVESGSAYGRKVCRA